MKLKIYAVFITCALLLMLACGGGMGNNGGGGGTPPNKTAKVAQHFNWVPGFGGQAKTKTTTNTTYAFDWSLTPKVYAQSTTTVAMTGNYSGFCQQVFPYYGKTLVYGLGSYMNQNGDCVEPLEYSTKESGQLVIGDGILTNLVVAVEKGSGTGDVTVYVNGIETQLKVPVVGAPDHAVRAVLSLPIQVKDGDYVSAVANFPDRGAQKLRVFIGKE